MDASIRQLLSIAASTTTSDEGTPRYKCNQYILALGCPGWTYMFLLYFRFYTKHNKLIKYYGLKWCKQESYTSWL